MHKMIKLALGMAVVVSLAGCGAVAEETWTSVKESTSRLYGTYINPPATVDYTQLGDVEEAQRVLARKIAGPDAKLNALERLLRGNDRPPSAETIEKAQQHLPWIAGFAAVSSSGEVMARVPEYDLKQLDLAAIIGKRLDQYPMSRELVGLVQLSPLGAEVMMGGPIFQNASYLGIFLAHFDVRSLFDTEADAAGVVVIAPEGVLWSGRFVYETTPLAKVAWEDVVKSSNQGAVSNEQGEFFWLVRYIGNQPLIFAVPVSGSFATDAAAMPEAAAKQESASQQVGGLLPAGPEIPVNMPQAGEDPGMQQPPFGTSQNK